MQANKFKIFHLFEKEVEILQQSATYLSISMTKFSLPLQRDIQRDDPAKRSLPSSKNPHFQNEAKCTVKMSLICMRTKTSFPYQRLCNSPRFDTEAAWGELGNGLFARVDMTPHFRNPRENGYKHWMQWFLGSFDDWSMVFKATINQS